MDTTELGSLGDLIVWLISLGAASVAYGKFVGPYQVRLTATVITTLALKSRWKPLANLLTGVALALMAFGAAAYATGLWQLLLPGLLAGFLSSVVAGDEYDAAKTDSGGAA